MLTFKNGIFLNIIYESNYTAHKNYILGFKETSLAFRILYQYFVDSN